MIDINTEKKPEVKVVTDKIKNNSLKPEKKYTFKPNLSLNMAGEDVRNLQKYLNKNGFLVAKSGPGSPGKETDKFGAYTRKALIKFQKAKHISPTIGYFGQLTRATVNK